MAIKMEIFSLDSFLSPINSLWPVDLFSPHLNNFLPLDVKVSPWRGENTQTGENQAGLSGFESCLTNSVVSKPQGSQFFSPSELSISSVVWLWGLN